MIYIRVAKCSILIYIIQSENETKYGKSNSRTEPSDPTDANRSLPPPSFVNAISCT